MKKALMFSIHIYDNCIQAILSLYTKFGLATNHIIFCIENTSLYQLSLHSIANTYHDLLLLAKQISTSAASV